MCFAWRPPSLKARIEVSSEVVWERDALFDSISTFLTCISASGLCAAASCRPLQIRIQLIVVVALIVFSGCPRACVLAAVSSRRCPRAVHAVPEQRARGSVRRLRPEDLGPLLPAGCGQAVAHALPQVLRVQAQLGVRAHLLQQGRQHLLQGGLLQVCVRACLPAFLRVPVCALSCVCEVKSLKKWK